MTFEQILLLYIYQHKKISLNLFGTIELEGVVPDPEIIRKEKQIPVEGLKFTFDPNVVTDETFIHFYASEKGRIIPLSASDIEAQLLMARQIVNIGNPFEIVGLGKIVKLDNGKLAMQPGFFAIPPISGSGRPAILRERVQTAPVPRTDRNADAAADHRKTVQWMVISAGIVVIALAIWAIFKFLIPGMQTSPASSENAVSPAVTDTLQKNQLPVEPDTVQAPVIDTLALLPWKAYISQAKTREYADVRLKRYQAGGHNVELETPDSTTFLIYINLQSSLSDTARQRDSLAKFFAYPVRLVPKTP